MKKKNLRLATVLMSGLCIFTTGCDVFGGGHTHMFNKKVAEEEYFQADATCEKAAQYYFSCECGEKGEKTFSSGELLPHDYSAEIETEEYLKKRSYLSDGW